MADKSEALNNQVNQINLNNSINNSNKFFISNNNTNNFIIKKNKIYKCEYCGFNFFSKFNKNRHVNEIHLNLNRGEKSDIIKVDIKNEILFEKNKEIEKDIIQETAINFFIGNKRKSTIDLNNLTTQNKKEKKRFI